MSRCFCQYILYILRKFCCLLPLLCLLLQDKEEEEEEKLRRDAIAQCIFAVDIGAHQASKSESRALAICNRQSVGGNKHTLMFQLRVCGR